MKRLPNRLVVPALAVAAVAAVSGTIDAACCYFSAKDKDLLQPAQKAFITWDPVRGEETFTVQPKFEGDAEDFGMVVPTPARPKLDEMPRDFFKSLAVYTILKQRKFPQSKLMPYPETASAPGPAGGRAGRSRGAGAGRPSVVVLEAGVVGTLDYKIIAADRADDLYRWLKEHRYHYAGDEATLDHYIAKRWLFTVMKIDPQQMKRGPDGRYTGEVSPTRFQFKSDRLVYPLRITQLSIDRSTEALFYVQAPYKVDLPGDLTYQYQWVPMLQNASGWYRKGTFGDDVLPGRGGEWLTAIEPAIEGLMSRGRELGFAFQSGRRPAPNADGRTASTLEWAKRLTDDDIDVLRGLAPYSETLPDVDRGYTHDDVRGEGGDEVIRTIQARLRACREERPGGYLIREAPAEDLRRLETLVGHLKAGQFLTKIRHTFTLDEMGDDLLLVPAQIGAARDRSEYEEILPTSPP